jgi:hypothetical protein
MLTGTTAPGGGMLHDRVVDRVGRAFAEGRLVEADEIAVGAGRGERLFAGGEHVGAQPLQFGQVEPDRK